jgi:hypothetical protein
LEVAVEEEVVMVSLVEVEVEQVLFTTLQVIQSHLALIQLLLVLGVLET